MASPYKVSHKPKKKSSEKTRFLILLILFTLVVLGFIYAVLLRTPPVDEQSTSPSLYPAIHAEDLGKTPGDLKQKYPDLFLSNDRYGNLLGRHKMDGAHYLIWFVAENGEKVAFRIKAEKTYPSLEEEELLDYFGSLYGRPFDGQCTGKSTYAIEKCHYKWWVRKMVSLDLYSRVTTKKEITLSAITTDTYLSTKHHQEIKSVLPIQ